MPLLHHPRRGLSDDPDNTLSMRGKDLTSYTQNAFNLMKPMVPPVTSGPAPHLLLSQLFHLIGFVFYTGNCN